LTEHDKAAIKKKKLDEAVLEAEKLTPMERKREEKFKDKRE